MTPLKALAWTSAYAVAASSIFWSWAMEFAEAAYEYWFVDLFFLCLLAPLSWYVYRSYRKGSMYAFFAKIPKSQKRAMAIVSIVVFVCAAAERIINAWLTFPDHKLWHSATASVWLLFGAENWRRYLELKGPELSSSQ